LAYRVRAMLVRLHDAFHNRTGVYLILPLLVAGTYIALLELDPFGLDAASHARSEQATLRIMAPWYESSGKVVAIYVDDDYITERKAGWPLPYVEQGWMMRAILRAEPAVLLIDLVYPHRHGTSDKAATTDQATQLTSQILNTGNIPIVFTALAKEEPFDFCSDELTPGKDTLSLLDPESLQDDLETELTTRQLNMPNSRVRLGYIRWSGCGDRYPLLLGGNPNTVTPAFAAYVAYCERNPTQASCPRKRPDRYPAEYLHPMIVQSSAFPPSTLSFAFSADACQALGDTETGHVPIWRRLATTVDQLAMGVLFGDPRNDPNNNVSLLCPAVTHVPLSTFVAASAEDRGALLKGKAVVFGAHLAGSRDIVNTPVHGQIPGVVWHAMALDNLLGLGPNYLADRHKSLMKKISAALVLAFAYLFPFVIWVIEHRWAKVTLATLSLGIWLGLAAIYALHHHPGIATVALVMGIALDFTKPKTSASYFLALFGALAGSWLSLQKGWPPGNWFGLLLVIIAFSHTVKPYYLGEERKTFPHKSSILAALYRRLKSKSETVHE
jgi:hypothetical protein